MDTRRLEQLVVLANSGSLRRAAEILKLSPGGLSKSLQVLQQDLRGGPLLVKSGRNVELSDFARQVLAAAPEVLAAVARLRGDALAPPAGPRPLRVATFEVFSTYFLGEYCARFLEPDA